MRGQEALGVDLAHARGSVSAIPMRGQEAASSAWRASEAVVSHPHEGSGVRQQPHGGHHGAEVSHPHEGSGSGSGDRLGRGVERQPSP